MTESIKISKTDIALVQLETAIDLFLNNKNFICAATLAGAAEEILGEIVGRSGKTNAFRELCASLKAAYNLDLTESKIGKDHVNYPRNELKHFKHAEQEILEIDVQSVAAGLIVRAVTNLIRHDQSVTHNTEVFLRWIYDNRPDLSPDYQDAK